MDPGQLLRSRFTEGEELFGFVGEVTERGISVHLSPKTHGFVPRMLADKDPEVHVQTPVVQWSHVFIT